VSIGALTAQADSGSPGSTSVNAVARRGGATESASVLIRREVPGDEATIRAVVAAAFAPVDPSPQVPEARLVAALRAGPAWLPALSLVATDPDGTVVGHVLATRGHVDTAPALGLGPLSVRPDRQRRGVGSALVHAVLGAADALGEPLVALLGDPLYYQRFGFRPSDDLHIAPPEPAWRSHFQVRPLTAYDPAVRGTFTYPAPFDDL
jgi:putative acetyltransferase